MKIRFNIILALTLILFNANAMNHNTKSCLPLACGIFGTAGTGLASLALFRNLGFDWKGTFAISLIPTALVGIVAWTYLQLEDMDNGTILGAEAETDHFEGASSDIPRVNLEAFNNFPYVCREIIEQIISGKDKYLLKHHKIQAMPDGQGLLFYGKKPNLKKILVQGIAGGARIPLYQIKATTLLSSSFEEAKDMLDAELIKAKLAFERNKSIDIKSPFAQNYHAESYNNKIMLLIDRIDLIKKENFLLYTYLKGYIQTIRQQNPEIILVFTAEQAMTNSELLANHGLIRRVDCSIFNKKPKRLRYN